MFTIKFYSTPTNNSKEQKTRIVSGDSIEISRIKPKELVEIVIHTGQNRMTFYIVDPYKHVPTVEEKDKEFWHEAFIENIRGSTTEIVRASY